MPDKSKLRNMPSVIECQQVEANCAPETFRRQVGGQVEASCALRSLLQGFKA
jgi:hypothetical protein